MFTDGRRDCISQTIPSALENLKGTLDFKIIHDDSADPDYKSWLHREFGPLGFRIIGSLTYKRGFGGSIAWMWETCDFALPETVQWLFHLEDDFTFNRPVDLEAMQDVLKANPHLVQLVLKRQPWNDEERKAGGIIEQHPEDYLQCNDIAGDEWVKHRKFFSTNPSLYRRSLTKIGWPDVPQSEGIFTHQLLEKPEALYFAFWGNRLDEPWVTHIGNQRVGIGY